MEGNVFSGFWPLYKNTPLLWRPSRSGCDAFDHPDTLICYRYKLDRRPFTTTTKQQGFAFDVTRTEICVGSALHITRRNTTLAHPTKKRRAGWVGIIIPERLSIDTAHCRGLQLHSQTWGLIGFGTAIFLLFVGMSDDTPLWSYYVIYPIVIGAASATMAYSRLQLRGGNLLKLGV